MNKLKTVVIIVLIAVIIGLGAYILFVDEGVQYVESGAKFLKEIQTVQTSLSYYLGSTYSDTFGIYSKVELLSGKATDDEGNSVDI